MRPPSLILALAIITATATARADDNAGVVVTGEATLQPQLAAQLEGWLRQHGHQLVAAPLEPDAINTLIDCFVIDDEGCARGLVDKRSKSHTVVYARVEVTPNVSDGTRDVTITGYWFEQGHDAVADRQLCERCTDPSLRRAADMLMASLAKAGEHDTGHVELTSSPSGARVLVDGQAVGVTPLDYDLAPGNHQITVNHDQRDVETRQVSIRRGETTRLDVPLVAIHAAGGRSRVVPGMMIGGGAAALVTAGVLLAINQDPSPTGPLEIRQTTPAGVAFGIAGAAAVGVGLYLWFRHGSDRAPVASVSHDTVYFGWVQRF